MVYGQRTCVKQRGLAETQQHKNETELWKSCRVWYHNVIRVHEHMPKLSALQYSSTRARLKHAACKPNVFNLAPHTSYTCPIELRVRSHVDVNQNVYKVSRRTHMYMYNCMYININIYTYIHMSPTYPGTSHTPTQQGLAL